MTKPATSSLHLNQSAFQDFLDCPRRFELRFLNETSWPAAQGSPLLKFERLTEIGNRFHQLCQQFFIGIDKELLSSSITDPMLRDLWDSFLPYGRSIQSNPSISEQILRIPFGVHFLDAKFDLIVQLPNDSLLIIDWKTAATKPSRTTLANRVQTYLYPYILHHAGGDLFPNSLNNSSSITMQYYYPLSSNPEEIFTYSDEEEKRTQQKITALIDQIEEKMERPSHFPLTEEQKCCNYCLYRSYCERGFDTSPLPLGLELEEEDLTNVHFDFDLIKEIDY